MSRDGFARIAAALLGAPVVAALVAAATTTLPGPRELVFALGFHLFVPLWVALACATPVLSGRAACGWLGALGVAAALVLVVHATLA